MLFIKLWLYLDFDLNVWCEGIYWYIIFSQLDLDHYLNLDLYLDFDLFLKAFIELIFAQLELNFIPDLDLSFDLYVKVFVNIIYIALVTLTWGTNSLTLMWRHLSISSSASLSSLLKPLLLPPPGLYTRGSTGIWWKSSISLIAVFFWYMFKCGKMMNFMEKIKP